MSCFVAGENIVFRQSALICLMVCACCTGTLRADCGSAAASSSWFCRDKILEIDCTYTGGVFGNVRGGERTGSSYMGLVELGVTADTEKLGLWRNGTFFVGSIFSHGPGISRFVGDYQDPVAFAYETPALLSEYWYEHRFLRDRVTIRVGQQDTCSTFFYLDSKADFINASFTCPPETCMPTLPHTSEGVAISVDLLNDVVFKFGVHNAEHGNHTNINDSHYDTQIEKRYSLFGTLPGFVFLGGWYDTTDIELAGNEFRENYGFSVGIDQTVWQKKPCRHSNGATQRVTFFTQVGTYKKDRSELRFYYDVGLTHRGLLRSRPNDLIGIACTTICFSPEYRTAETLPYKYEAAFECFYKFQVSDNMVLQPDFQYIVHPGGQHADATLLGLVFQIAL